MKNNDQKAPAINDLSYEEALKKLEEIIESLESHEHSLEEALSLFERGQELSSYCSKLLNNAELRIKTISNESIIDFPESS